MLPELHDCARAVGRGRTRASAASRARGGARNPASSMAPEGTRRQTSCGAGRGAGQASARTHSKRPSTKRKERKSVFLLPSCFPPSFAVAMHTAFKFSNVVDWKSLPFQIDAMHTYGMIAQAPSQSFVARAELSCGCR